jgi:hypothetical protein
MAKNPLSLVPNPRGSAPNPPRPLGDHGKALWARVTSEYDVSDAAGIAMLGEACVMLDRAEELAAEIKADGPVIRIRGQIKDHPALKHELAARAFVCRTLQRMGLNYEPLRSTPGRPPGSGA